MMLCLCCPCVMMTVHTHLICDINGSNVQRKRHSVLCYDGSECKSRLRILRLASCHYQVS